MTTKGTEGSRAGPASGSPVPDHFLAEMNRGSDRPKRWSRMALERLRQSPWIGNVRELRNVVQRAYILGDTEIAPDVLPPLPGIREARGGRTVLEVKVGASIAEVEQQLILATLEQTGGDKRRAAEILGMSLKTLYNRLNVYQASGALERPAAPAQR